MARNPKTRSQGSEVKKRTRAAAEVIAENRKNPGRPPTYHEEFPRLVGVLILVGGILNDAADLLGVSVQVVEVWMKKYPDFVGSIKRASQNADERVKRSLYERAMGYEHRAVKIFYNPEQGPVCVPYTEKYAPDTGAMAFWLKNRDPDNWRERREGETNTTAEEAQRILREQVAALDTANEEPGKG